MDAVDISHDPKNGDASKLAEAIRVSKDRLIGYVIYNSRTFSGTTGKQPFVWRKYTGQTHMKHVHLDVIDKHQDDTTHLKALLCIAVGRSINVRSPMQEAYETIAPRGHLLLG